MDDLKDLMNLDVYDVIKILRNDGIIIGFVIMNMSKFIKRCNLLGFNPDAVSKYIIDCY